MSETIIYPIGSTDEVLYKQTEMFLSEKLDNIESAINSKANSTHTHTATDITGLAEVATSGDYNDLTNKPVIEEYSHPDTHPVSMITGLADVAVSGDYEDLVNKPTIPTSLPANGGNADTVDGKNASDFATSDHTHATNDITGLDTALSSKANNTHSHTEYATISDVETLETTVNSKANANHTHTQYASTSDVSALQTALNGKASVNHSHTEYAGTDHTHPQYATVSDVTNIETTVNGKADSNHTHSQYANTIHSHSDYATNTALTNGLNGKANTSHTHAQSDITGLATALSNKANSNHNHDSSYSQKALQITSDTGAFKYSYRTADNVNVLTAIKDLPNGVFTVYSQAGVSGNPKTTEAWRMLVHKTGDTVLWVKAFGSLGSEYSNYCADGVWQGWRCIYDVAPVPLWSGEMYMASTHTIIPTKPLSECRNGWLLVWSDYNPGESVQNVDFATTVIPKKNYNGGAWSGNQFLCTVPKHSDTDGDGIIVKTLHISNTQIVGNSLNNVSPRNDVVLRAVYEF